MYIVCVACILCVACIVWLRGLCEFYMLRALYVLRGLGALYVFLVSGRRRLEGIPGVTFDFAISILSV